MSENNTAAPDTNTDAEVAQLPPPTLPSLSELRTTAAEALAAEAANQAAAIAEELRVLRAFIRERMLAAAGCGKQGLLIGVSYKLPAAMQQLVAELRATGLRVECQLTTRGGTHTVTPEQLAPQAAVTLDMLWGFTDGQ